MKFINRPLLLILLLILALSGCVEQQHPYSNNTTASSPINDLLPWWPFWNNNYHDTFYDQGYTESNRHPTYYAPSEDRTPTTSYSDFYSQDTASSSQPATESYSDFYDVDTSSSSSSESSTYADFYDTGGIDSYSDGSDFGDGDFGDSYSDGGDFGGSGDYGGDDFGGGDW